LIFLDFSGKNEVENKSKDEIKISNESELEVSEVSDSYLRSINFKSLFLKERDKIQKRLLMDFLNQFIR